MGASALAGPLLSAGKSAASGGKGGGGGGGVSPQQAALAQYTMGQQELATSSNFANQGMGLSTNKTFAEAGPQMGAAMTLAGLADQNAATNQQIAQAEQNQNTQNAGFGQGFQPSGNFGSSQGGFNATPSNDASGGDALA